MTKQDKTFVQDWVSADVWALDGKYYRKDPEYLPKLLLKTWTKMFERVPVTQKAMYVFLWKAMQMPRKSSMPR
jgi:hypothetical protein